MYNELITAMDEKLSDKRCVPCEGGTLPLPYDQASLLLVRLKNPWTISETGKKIYYKFVFKDFAEAIIFVNKVASIAEAEQHHPDINIRYNEVTVELWTHAIGGLSENDYILAAKIEESLAD